MRCLLCWNLEQALLARRAEYMESGSLAYYSVSKKIAAYRNVEMERALIELEEHRAVCGSAISDLAHLPAVSDLHLRTQDALPVDAAGTVAR